MAPLPGSLCSPGVNQTGGWYPFDWYWQYNQVGYFVVQRIIEGITGRPLSELMAEKIFRPAGMTTAQYWGSSEQVVPGVATGYYPNSVRGLVRRQFDFPSHLYSAAGLAASLNDLIHFDQSLTSGRLLSDASFEALLQPTTLNDGTVNSYGLGWDLEEHAPGHTSVGHAGGYLTTYRLYQTGDLSVIVLTNGFTASLETMKPDRLATALASVWEPQIIGHKEPPCDLTSLESAQF